MELKKHFRKFAHYTGIAYIVLLSLSFLFNLLGVDFRVDRNTCFITRDVPFGICWPTLPLSFDFLFATISWFSNSLYIVVLALFIPFMLIGSGFKGLHMQFETMFMMLVAVWGFSCAVWVIYKFIRKNLSNLFAR